MPERIRKDLARLDFEISAAMGLIEYLRNCHRESHHASERMREERDHLAHGATAVRELLHDHRDTCQQHPCWTCVAYAQVETTLNEAMAQADAEAHHGVHAEPWIDPHLDDQLIRAIQESQRHEFVPGRAGWCIGPGNAGFMVCGRYKEHEVHGPRLVGA